MDQTKPWWLSSGVLGAAGAVAGYGLLALNHFGVVQIDVNQAQTVGNDLVSHVAIIAGAVSGIVAMIGRIRATKKIG